MARSIGTTRAVGIELPVNDFAVKVKVGFGQCRF